MITPLLGAAVIVSSSDAVPMLSCHDKATTREAHGSSSPLNMRILLIPQNKAGESCEPGRPQAQGPEKDMKP